MATLLLLVASLVPAFASNPWVPRPSPEYWYPWPHPTPIDQYPDPNPVGQPSGTAPSFSKCDSNVMNAIRNTFWNTYGVPNNIINRFIADGRGVVYATTTGYVPNGATCIYSYFFPTYLNAYILSSNGYTSSGNVYIQELEGSIYESSFNTIDIILLIYRGVTLSYTCDLNDDAPVGPPQGFIKHREFNADLSFAFNQAPQLMATVGIFLGDYYSMDC